MKTSPVFQSKSDLDDYCYTKGIGEFGIKSDFAFNNHLKKLHRYVQIAKREFGCEKGQEFINYVLQNEPYWYKQSIRFSY